MALQDAEARKQICQMRNFILNEAKDKAQEIEAKTLEDFNLEKLKLVQQMKNKVRQEYRQKAKQIETERTVARSVLINKFRLDKLEARHKIFESIHADTEAKLREVVNSKDKYKALCADLITQSALFLLENQLLVRCRPEDEKIITEAINIATKTYSEIIKKEANGDRHLTLSIDTQNYLPSGSDSNHKSAKTCIGGVKVVTKNGKALIDNTLDTRLDLVMQQCMPTIRKTLFAEQKAR